MKNCDHFDKLGLRLGLLTTVVFACSLASLSPPVSQTVPTSTSPGTYPTGTAEAEVTKVSTSQPALNPIMILTSTVTSQPSHAVATQPTNALIQPPPKEFNHTQKIYPFDIVWEMLGQVSKDRALTDLRKLTGEEEICINTECYKIADRLTGSVGLHWAKDYIYEELVGLGYSVLVQDWSRSGHADQNIIARKMGILLPDEEIYFVAHMDGVRTDVEKQYPAADDNASGVVDILELARMLKNYSFSRTLVLFFSTGEEQGTLGVEGYLDQLTSEELQSIKYVVNVDMVGYDENEDGVMELWDGGHDPTRVLTQMMSDIVLAYQIDLKPILVNGCT